jgi:hypothetical protein
VDFLLQMGEGVEQPSMAAQIGTMVAGLPIATSSLIVAWKAHKL